MSYGIQELGEATGMNITEMMAQSVMDGTAPAICTKCGYTTDMEPDQDQGWCDKCQENTMVSAPVLLGAI